MNILLKRAILFFTLLVGSLATFLLPAFADSTADIILSTRCQGGYNISIWQDYASGEFLYRATSPSGDLSLNGGTREVTENVRVYKFQDENYEYWVWDGTLDDPQSGVLEVYENNRILMHQSCTRS